MPLDPASDIQTKAIIGAAFEVHSQLGHGFLEAVYLNAMAEELMRREIPFRREVPIPVFYKGRKLACGYRCDLYCFECVIVELKAQAGLTEVDEAQVINYLRATEVERALLFNFGTPKLQFKRFILTDEYRRGTQRIDRKP